MNGGPAMREVYRTAFNPRRVSMNSPSLLALSPDHVVLWYFGGFWEGRADVALWSQTLSRRDDGSWFADPERIVFKVPGFTVGNAVPVLGPDGSLHLFVVVSRPGSWETAQVWRLESADGGRTYHKSVLWGGEPGTMVGTPALRDSDGTWLLPVYSELGWEVWTVRLGGRDLDSLEEGNRITTPGGCIQLCLATNGLSGMTGFLRTRDGEIYRTASPDGIRFSVPRSTGIPNPNARVAVVKIGQDPGDLLLVYNPASEGRLHLEGTIFSSGRTCLRAALSVDGGQTFPRHLRRDLELGTGEYAYPWAVSLEGHVLLAYQAHRSQIRVCELTRDWFLEDRPIATPETFPEALEDLRTEPAKRVRAGEDLL